jgi:hypothetical protein
LVINFKLLLSIIFSKCTVWNDTQAKSSSVFVDALQLSARGFTLGTRRVPGQDGVGEAFAGVESAEVDQVEGLVVP